MYVNEYKTFAHKDDDYRRLERSERSHSHNSRDSERRSGRHSRSRSKKRHSRHRRSHLSNRSHRHNRSRSNSRRSHRRSHGSKRSERHYRNRHRHYRRCSSNSSERSVCSNRIHRCDCQNGRLLTPIATQSIEENAKTSSDDYPQCYSQILANLTDYAFEVPPENHIMIPSKVDRQILPSTSYEAEDLDCDLLSFLSEMLNETTTNTSFTNVLDNTPLHTHRIDPTEPEGSGENTDELKDGNGEENVDCSKEFIEICMKETISTDLNQTKQLPDSKMVFNDKKNELEKFENFEKQLAFAYSSLERNQYLNKTAGLNECFVVAGQHIGALEWSQLNTVCYVKLPYLQDAPTFTNQVTKEEEIRTDSTQPSDSPVQKFEFEAASSIIKNNNPDWHFLNSSKTCQICNCVFSKSSLVKHYVNAHPNSEVFPSRVSPDVGRLLRSLKYVPKCEIIDRDDGRWYYKQYCYFCNAVKCFRKDRWTDHMITHTGYYTFECTNCSMKFERNSKHVCVVEKYNVRKVAQPQLKGANVVAYLCDLCNFVRFNKNEIEKHLRYEHEGDNVMDDAFEEIVFLSFPCKEVAHKMEKSNDDKIAEKKDGTTNNQSLAHSLINKVEVAEASKRITAIVKEAENELSSTNKECCCSSTLPTPVSTDEYEDGWESDYIAEFVAKVKALCRRAKRRPVAV